MSMGGGEPGNLSGCPAARQDCRITDLGLLCLDLCIAASAVPDGVQLFKGKAE